MSTSSDIDGLLEAIKRAYGLVARHTGTVPLVESFRGATVWQGAVEVFDVEHATARHCYGWRYDDDTGPHFVAVLGAPPIDTPRRAVQAHIASLAKK